MTWGCEEGVLQTGRTFAHVGDSEAEKACKYKGIERYRRPWRPWEPVLLVLQQDEVAGSAHGGESTRAIQGFIW